MGWRSRDTDAVRVDRTGGPPMLRDPRARIGAATPAGRESWREARQPALRSALTSYPEVVRTPSDQRPSRVEGSEAGRLSEVSGEPGLLAEKPGDSGARHDGSYLT